jgi:RsiW-degrading membrane proteinase PrsW (M82 family)
MSRAATLRPSGRMMDLLESADQDRVRADLKAFLGPRADVFLGTYETMRKGPNGPRLYVRTWCWPGFFCAFAWFFYRKRYVEGAILVLLPLLTRMLFGITFGVGAWAAFAVCAGVAVSAAAAGALKPYYVQVGLRRILKVDELCLSGAERSDYLRRAGGVSVATGAIAGFGYFGVLALVLAWPSPPPTGSLPDIAAHGVAVLLCAVVPALAMLGYGVIKTRGRWGSGMLVETYFVGAVCGLAASAPEAIVRLGLHHLSPLPGAALTALFASAVPEEAAKFFVLVFIALRHVDARRMQDVILLALAIAMGLTTLENIAYVAAPGNWKLMAFERAVTPFHGVLGLVMGALVVRARLASKGAGLRWMLALLLPVLMHTAYDFPPMLGHLRPELSGLTFLLWVVVTTPLPILAVSILNPALRAAVAVDRRTGRDGESQAPALGPAAGGMIALGAVAAAIAMATLVVDDKLQLWLRAAQTAIPVILALDLFDTAWRRSSGSEEASAVLPPP